MKKQLYTGEETMPESVTLTPVQFRKFANNLIRDYKMQLEMNGEEDLYYYASLLSTALSNAACAIKGLDAFFPAAFAIEEREHRVWERKHKAA
jgi:hypothetical protein